MKKISILFIAFLFLSGCAKIDLAKPLVKKSHLALGTIVEVTVADRDKSRQAIEEAIQKAFAEIDKIENLFSRFKPESDISRINKDAYVRTTKVNLETINLLERAIDFSRLTEGAFDITIWPLMELWGFAGKKRQQLPSVEELTLALDKVGYTYIDIIKPEQSVFLARPGMSLDLGGIATGYAVDRAITVLKEKGIKNALVNAGGDIYCLGERAKEKKWRIAIQHPRIEKSFLTVIEVKNKAIATSGDYQKYVEIEGRRYSHIINPKSGYPSSDIPASVTVVAEDCLSADALSTSVFVLGPKEGIDLINQLKNTEAIVATFSNGKLDISLSHGLSKEELGLTDD